MEQKDKVWLLMKQMNKDELVKQKCNAKVDNYHVRETNASSCETKWSAKTSVKVEN